MSPHGMAGILYAHHLVRVEMLVVVMVTILFFFSFFVTSKAMAILIAMALRITIVFQLTATGKLVHVMATTPM